MAELSIEQKRALAMANARLRMQGETSERPVTDETSAERPAMSWGDAAIRSVTNIPKSAVNFASDLVQPILHPIDTGKALLDVTAGGVSKLTPGKKAPQAIEHEAAFDNVMKFFADRYGGVENFKKTLADDPVGLAADLSTVLSLGGAVAARVPGTTATATAKTLKTAANAIDPVNLAAKGVAKATRGVGEVASQVVGNLGTHTGADSIKEAARAGYVGGEAGKVFRDNLRGNVAVSSILDDAKLALSKIRDARSADYRSGMANVAKDKTVLDFAPIDKAISNVDNVKTYKGIDLSKSTAAIRQSIKDAIAEWKALDPAEYHTPEGMDALKQKLSDVRDATDFNTPARKVADQAYNAVKTEIAKQAPEYTKIMKDYETTSEMIREAEKALSLGKKSSADTAIRKLQSVLRSNVNSNFGSRADLAKTIDEAGGANIRSAAAGQSMNTFTPRGLGGMGTTAITAGSATLNPALLAMLPFQSPRAVGEVVHAGGRVAGAGAKAVRALPPEYADAIRQFLASTPAHMGLYQAGRTATETD